MKIIRMNSVIQFLFLDGEGAEYALLPYFLSGALDHVGICQISLELHGPIQRYGIKSDEDYDILMRNFFRNSNYIPIWVQSLDHNRIFMIDIKNSQCIAQFYRGLC